MMLKQKRDADSLYDDFVSNMNAMGDDAAAGDMELKHLTEELIR